MAKSARPTTGGIRGDFLLSEGLRSDRNAANAMLRDTNVPFKSRGHSFF